MTNKLKTAIEAAKIGAQEALSYFDNKKNLNTKFKQDKTIVTVADTATENVIKKYLKSKYPQIEILGEETGGSIKSNSFWTVDPIDGTRIFARGINAWAVLISYYEKNDFQIGVCYFPCINEVYYAEKGKGAYLNGKKIKVSSIKPLSQSLINSGNPSYFKNLNILLDLIKNAQAVRNYETTYADCLVAAGKVEASIDPYMQLWDFAPFAVIIPESGGRITNLSGKKLQLTDRGAVMSNGLTHEELINIVNRQ